ncbi:hypothetical protein TRVA0_017S02520 [Trichomonascus vanleenenianus]|uniref:uncharacterized protein n=1 Tax=Trichomonascus vanleenenianus TaxID=2268995 RepID=UPI003ECAF516
MVLKALISTTILNTREIPMEAIEIKHDGRILGDDEIVQEAVGNMEYSTLACTLDMNRVELIEPREPSQPEYPRIIDASPAIQSFRRVFPNRPPEESSSSGMQLPDVRQGPLIVPKINAVPIDHSKATPSPINFYHGSERITVDSSEYMLIPNISLEGEYALCLAPSVVSRHPVLSNTPPLRVYSKTSSDPKPSQLFQEIAQAQEHVEKELTVEIEPENPPLSYMEQRIVDHMRRDMYFRMTINTISHLGNAWGIAARNASDAIDFVYERRAIIFGTIGVSCVILANSVRHLPTRPALLLVFAATIFLSVLGILTAVERGVAALNSSQFRRNFVNIIASLNPEIGPGTHYVDVGTDQLIVRHNQPRTLLKIGHITAMFFMSLFPGLQRQIMERTNELRNNYREILRKAEEEREQAIREYEELEQYVDGIVTHRRAQAPQAPPAPQHHDEHVE